MRLMALAGGLLVTALNGGVSAQRFGGILPPPPPAPPAIADKVLDRAVRSAFQCPPGGDGRPEAQRAVDALTPSSSDAQRAAARALVLEMVRRREAQKQCIWDLSVLADSRHPSENDPDRAAYKIEEGALVENWVEQAPYEAAVLARFIDPTIEISPRSLP